MTASLIFLRPWWLAALLLLPALMAFQRWRRGERNAWEQAVDPHLLPHLIETGTAEGASAWSWLRPAGAALAILALAGPSWQESPTPLWQVDAPLVIALDLSSAMLTADLAPSRLVQARSKVSELLEKRRGGQFGLIVFAGDAFTAAPITRDAGTIQAVVQGLAPDLMPVDGQRADRAIEHAVAMMASGGFRTADILLVTDHADALTTSAARRALSLGFRVSALGVGTAAGAPRTGTGGFVTNAQGQVQLARLDLGSLKVLASAGGGKAVPLTADSSDLQNLGLLVPDGGARPGTSAEGGSASKPAMAMERTDDGYWLVLVLLPLALLGFRRSSLAVLVLAVALVGASLPGTTDAATHAATVAGPGGAVAPAGAGGAATAPGWSSAWTALWQRPDQRARAALDAGDFARARQLAPNGDLRGVAAYRSDDYAAAAREFASNDSADAHYNQGNALAKAGEFQQALAAYTAALKRAPDMADARTNRKAVEDFLKKQSAANKWEKNHQDQPDGQKQPKGENQPQPGNPSPGEDQQQDSR